MSVLEELSEAVIQGEEDKVQALTNRALDENVEPGEILNNGLLAGMGIVSERFKKAEFFIPEVLIAALSMKAGMVILRPKLISAGVELIGTAVLGTVKGDLHDIGKNLVGMMLEGSGFEVIDLGINVESDQFLAAAKEHDASLIGLSTLLTTTMSNMKTVVEGVQSGDFAGKVKVMIGGAPVTQSFCDEIGADGYAPDAATAADLAKELVA